MRYITFYGEEEGRYQFSMWEPVTDLDLLTVAYERATQMVKEMCQ